MRIFNTLLLVLFSILLNAQDGLPDETFGDGGIVLTSLTPADVTVSDIATQSDDKIIVSGNLFDGMNRDLIAIRYLPDGQIDSSFAVDGSYILGSSAEFEFSSSIAVDDQDQIYIVGARRDPVSTSRAIVIKLLADGAIDASFDQDGIWESTGNSDGTDIFTDILIQQDGKILVAGLRETSTPSKFAFLARFNPDGTLDNDFGNGGISLTPVPDEYSVNTVAVNSIGEIVVQGVLFNFEIDLYLMKFDPQGQLDETFGTNGVVTRGDEFAGGMTIQPDDKILIPTKSDFTFGDDFGILRYNSDGTLDDSFGVNGRTSIDPSQDPESPTSILIQADGKIIIAGSIGFTLTQDFALARFDSDGVLDPTFGINGSITVDDGLSEVLVATTFQSNGSIVVAGNAGFAIPNASIMMLRFSIAPVTNVTILESDPLELDLFPNPSTGLFNVSVDLDAPTSVSMTLYDSAGRMVKQVLQKAPLGAGTHSVEVNLTAVPTGIYFMQVETEQRSVYRKVILSE